MKSREQLIGEAVASLTARLDAWAGEEPREIAQTFITDMLRNGWRPAAAPPIARIPTNGRRSTNPTAHVQACRDAIAQAREDVAGTP